MGDEKELLTLLKGRINDQIFNLKADKILFYAKIDVDHHVSKKNNRPIFRAGQRSFMGKSQKLRTAEDAMVLQLRSEANKFGVSKPIGSDLWALCLFYFENYNLRKKEKRSKRLNDLSNLFELPMDCLETAGIIEDDTQICSFDLSRRLPGDHNMLELFLIKYENTAL
jgi:Holliday junction resolvase RusA-like endonuclease